MNNPKNAGMQKMTDKVMRGAPPLAQQMEDDGTRWKNLSQASKTKPVETKVKYRKDGSIRKTIEGDRVKWDDDLGEQRIVTKYRKDGTKKKEVVKEVTSKGKWRFDTSGNYKKPKPNQTIGYETNVKKYDKEGVEKSNKTRKLPDTGQERGYSPKHGGWDERYKTSPKAILKETGKLVGASIATMAGTALIPIIGLAGVNAVNKRKYNKWAKENPGKRPNNNPYR